MTTTAIIELLQDAQRLGRDWADVEHDTCDAQDDAKFAADPGSPVDAAEVLQMHNLGLPEDKVVSQCALQVCLLARRERWAELLAEQAAEQAAEIVAEADAEIAPVPMDIALAAIKAHRPEE